MYKISNENNGKHNRVRDYNLGWYNNKQERLDA